MVDSPGQTIRRGNLFLLGAGASVDAQYPTADALLSHFDNVLREDGDGAAAERYRFFEDHLKRYREIAAQVGELALPTRMKTPDEGRLFSGGTVTYHTAERRLFFGAVAPERRKADPQAAERAPYLEDFFAFWDLVYQPPMAALSWDSIKDLSPQNIHVRRYFLRQLRDQAVRLTYDFLDPARHSLAKYLVPLLTAPGPDGSSVIATLNFDLVVEHLAQEQKINFRDGFHQIPNLLPPVSWYAPLSDAWNDLFESDGIDVFVGFDTSATASETVELVKIHGSLGWVRIEEGDADLGWSDLLRQNIHLTTFRFNPKRILAGDEDIHTFSGTAGFSCKSGRHLTGKMGAVWFRPDLVFAQARKVAPGSAMETCLQRFRYWLRLAKRLTVIGYAWRDPDINDLILAQVADRLEVLNVGFEPLPSGLVELIVNKFPTTHRRILQRWYCAGGGARAVLSNGTATDFNGVSHSFDFQEMTQGDLPAYFNLGQYLESGMELAC